MKIIFLDIDGVLVTTRSNWDVIKERDLSTHQHDYFDRLAVENLNRLIKEADAHIVISSTWGKSMKIDKIGKILKNGGVRGYIIDTTAPKDDAQENHSHDHKGVAIRKWLRKIPSIESYVIIDDQVVDISRYHPGRYVETNCKYGFGDEAKLFAALEILNTPTNESSFDEEI